MIAVRGIGQRPRLVDDAYARFLSLDDYAVDLIELGSDLRMQGHGRFDRSLCVELGWERYLEKYVLHHIAAEGLRQRQRLAFEEHVLEAPCLGRQRRGIPHLTLEREERMTHRATGRIACGPTLAGSGIGSVTVRAQGAAIHPGVRDGIDDLIARPTEHRRDHRGGRYAYEKHMIEADAVETVLQSKHALNLMGLDHLGQYVANFDRLAATRQIIRHGQDTAQIIRRVTPFSRQPGVVEIQPANHAADIERRVDGIEFVRGPGHARAAGEGRAGNHGPHELGAGRIFQRLKTTGKRVHQTIARRLVSQRTGDLEAERVIRDCRQQMIGGWPFG